MLTTTTKGRRGIIIVTPVSLQAPMTSLLRPVNVTSEKMSSQRRTRQKLDHMSDGEKLMRRKLKNRVAAQTARDRKKARMDDLELTVKRLIKKTNNLSEEVKKLTTHNLHLEKENVDLRLRLDLEKDSVSDINIKQEPSRDDDYLLPREDLLPGVYSSSSESIEQAWLINDSLLKGQDPLMTVLWTMHLVGLMMLSTISFWMSSKKCANSWMNLTSAIDNKSQRQLMTILDNVEKKTKNAQQIPIGQWWKAHQRKWKTSRKNEIQLFLNLTKRKATEDGG